MSRAVTAPVGATGTHARRRCAASRCSSCGPTARWTGATRCEGGNGSRPKRPARVPRRVPRPDAGGGDAPAPAPARKNKPAVRRRTVAATDRGKALTDEEKAVRMRELRERAAAPRVAELADAVRRACDAGEYKPAQAAYAELKAVPDGVVPPDVFETMLSLCARLRMPSSAEGVFIDSLAAGAAPTESACWKLLETFESSGESRRAEKVLAYMESRGIG